MGLASSLALRLAGIDSRTADPAGGTIVRSADGDATGVVKDRAMELVQRAVPVASEAADDAALDAAMSFVAQHGVTSVHNMGTWENLAVFRRAHARKKLRTRIYAAVPLRTWSRLQSEIAESGAGDEWLRIGALKEFVDGSLGSHTALFVEPYNDQPESRGLLLTPQEEMLEWMIAADAAGLHCVTHAIGDRATGMLLDMYLRVAQRNGARDRRFRVEHAQHLRAEHLPRFAGQGVIASVQPSHLADDGRWAARAIGSERCKLTYAFRSLLHSGATVAMGSDWFVAPPVPLQGIAAAVTRRTLDGANPGGWIPGEKISVEQALHGYTTAAAYSSFDENSRGSLAPGKLADMVLLDRDITSVPADELQAARVEMTIAGGDVIYDAASAKS
jgi:predicted amidohydrolase YtcJ